MFFKFTRIQSVLHVTTTCTDRQTCLSFVYIKRHYVLTNVVRALMAHPMEKPYNPFLLGKRQSIHVSKVNGTG